MCAQNVRVCLVYTKIIYCTPSLIIILDNTQYWQLQYLCHQVICCCCCCCCCCCWRVNKDINGSQWHTWWDDQGQTWQLSSWAPAAGTSTVSCSSLWLQAPPELMHTDHSVTTLMFIKVRWSPINLPFTAWSFTNHSLYSLLTPNTTLNT